MNLKTSERKGGLAPPKAKMGAKRASKEPIDHADPRD
jgi:hypothetical protein